MFKSARQIYLANNEDIFIPSGMLFTNQRGINKTALLMPPDEPLKWLSRYGSVTFCQSGKEFPSGGMNEAGLIVEQTTLRETIYPAPDNRPGIKELQLIQYLLDTCATVDDALKCLPTLRIAQAASPIQFVLADQAGNLAFIAFLNGQLQIIRENNIPVPVLTNSIYHEAYKYFETKGKESSKISDEYVQNSLERFCIAAKAIKRLKNQETLELTELFGILDAVKRPDTLWNIIYDPLALKIYLKTRWTTSEAWVNFSELDFSSPNNSLALNLQNPFSGDLHKHFVGYSTTLNRVLIDSFFHNELLQQALGLNVPDSLLEYLAAYPQQMAMGD
jgi:choloylglycine hydrolase